MSTSRPTATKKSAAANLSDLSDALKDEWSISNRMHRFAMEVTTNPDLLLACVATPNSYLTLRLTDYDTTKSFLRAHTQALDEPQRQALIDTVITHAHADFPWRNGLAHLDHRTFRVVSAGLKSDDHVDSIRRYAQHPDDALHVITTMEGPDSSTGVKKVAKALAVPFRADPTRLGNAMLTRARAWPDVFMHLAGESADLPDLPSNLTAATLTPIRERVAKDPLSAVPLLRTGRMVHPYSLHDEVTALLEGAAASSPMTRDAMIGAVLERPVQDEQDLAVTAITTALRDTRVDHHLWPSTQRLLSGASLLGYLQALSRTPSLVSHAGSVEVVFGLPHTPLKDGYIEARQALRTIRAFAPTIDRTAYATQLQDTLSTNSWPKKMESRLLLDGLAVTPSEQAAVSIVHAMNPPSFVSFTTGADATTPLLTPATGARCIAQLNQHPALKSAVVSHLAAHLADGEPRAGEWLAAIADQA